MLAALTATSHARPGGWLSMVGLTAVTVALQCHLTNSALGTVSAAYAAPPGAWPTLLARTRAFFAGAVIKTASLFLALLAIGAAVETATDEDEDGEGGGGAYGKRRRAGAGGGMGMGGTGATGRLPASTPMSTATVPAATRAHPQPTGPVVV